MYYRFSTEKVQIKEENDNQGMVFTLEFHDSEMYERFRLKVVEFFETNHDPVDVNFIPFVHNRWQAFVSKGYREQFLLKLLEHGVITTLSHEVI